MFTVPIDIVGSLPNLTGGAKDFAKKAPPRGAVETAG
jgi:hypothetical protein